VGFAVVGLGGVSGEESAGRQSACSEQGEATARHNDVLVELATRGARRNSGAEG
jgi:hypothetical protein